MSKVQTQERAYNIHLEEKTSVMSEVLEGVGYGHLCTEIIPSSLKDGYRNRAKFKIYPRNGRIELRGTDPIQGEVFYGDALWILPEWGRELVTRIAEIISSKFQAFPVDGFEIRLTHGREEAHTLLSVKRTHSLDYSEFSSTLLTEISELKGVAIPSQKAEFGRSFLNHKILDTDIRAHYDAFFQSNILLTPDLVEEVRDSCRQSLSAKMLDLYCGVGLFSLLSGKKERKIKGVDSSRKAIESAQKNADRLGLKNASYVCSSVQEYFQKHDVGSQDIIFVDPPRSGCQAQVISMIASLKPEKICLVSCAIDTHVRDLFQWKKEGYTAESLRAVDMFPFTEFIETVTLLNRQK
jgi:tRNA/tmRNA/rRNA uracil-C5-methylase (TrmA/RlmC/RlmD family)